MRAKTVLVIDDDPDILEQVSAMMSADGYRVVTAGGEAEAEDVLLTVRPDLVILDLMMDHMDSGFVLDHHLKKLYPEAPIILLTAVTAATGMSFAAESPEAQSWVKVDKVLNKPVRPDQIRAEVRRLLKEQSGPGAEGAHETR